MWRWKGASDDDGGRGNEIVSHRIEMCICMKVTFAGRCLCVCMLAWITFILAAAGRLVQGDEMMSMSRQHAV